MTNENPRTPSATVDLPAASSERGIDEALVESFPASDPPAYDPPIHDEPEHLAPATYTPPPPAWALKVARGLGWFSLALGATEIFGGAQLAAAIGLDHRVPTVRLFGGREISAGIAVLAQKNPAPALWARVAGDVLDVKLLVDAFPARGRLSSSRRTGRVVALGAVLGVTVLDILAATSLSRSRKRALRASGIG